MATFLGLTAALGTALPPSAVGAAPLVSIVVDDLGYRLQEGRDAIGLPGVLSFSFLPHTPHARTLARLAHDREKEVILHLPMQSSHDKRLGPGGITLDMSREEVARTVELNLSAIPFVAGVSNHMGSLLTRDNEVMLWIMRAIKRHDAELFFLDSLTTSASRASAAAEAADLSTLRRDIFIDHHRDPTHIGRQLDALMQIARERGAAVGVAHPYPETIAVLRQRLPTLSRAEGVCLVRLSDMAPTKRRSHQWPASSSRLHRAAKSSKPSPSSTCSDGPE